MDFLFGEAGLGFTADLDSDFSSPTDQTLRLFLSVWSLVGYPPPPLRTHTQVVANRTLSGGISKVLRDADIARPYCSNMLETRHTSTVISARGGGERDARLVSGVVRGFEKIPAMIWEVQGESDREAKLGFTYPGLPLATRYSCGFSPHR